MVNDLQILSTTDKHLILWNLWYCLEVNRYIWAGRYIGPIFVFFFLYRHRPISVFSSADLKSGTSAGSPVLLVLWNVCCRMWRTPSQNFWKIQQKLWEIKARLKFLYFKVLWPYIYYILLVNYEVLLHSVKEKMNSTEPSGTGIMLQLFEGSNLSRFWTYDADLTSWCLSAIGDGWWHRLPAQP